MVLRPRFIFRGNAAAFGGRLSRPSDLVFESSVASSLTSTGGRSVSASGPKQYGDVVRFSAASTLAEGLFDDAEKLTQCTLGQYPERSLTATTTVTVQLKDLVVGTEPKLTIEMLRATLRGRSAAGSGEPPIQLGDDTVLRGVAIGGHKLLVDLNIEIFRRCDTCSKLLVAADDPQFVRDHGDNLFMSQPFEGRPLSPTGRLVEGRHYIHATIVKHLRWEGTPFPGAEIDRHSIAVPELGRIFFGELLIRENSRRLAMVRFELGSPNGGYASAGEVETNGSWSF
jgi:hypothetical protein